MGASKSSEVKDYDQVNMSEDVSSVAFDETREDHIAPVVTRETDVRLTDV